MAEKGKQGILGMSKLTYKYQLTVPKRVRQRFDLREGDVLVFFERDGTLVMAKSTEV